jgi:hypothetical protein
VFFKTIGRPVLPNRIGTYIMSILTSQSHFKAGHSSISTSSEPTLAKSKNAALTNRESDERYKWALLQFDPATRIIVCKDNWQWILQTKDLTGGRWRAVSYCRTRKGIERTLKKMGHALPTDWPQFFREVNRNE